MPALARAPLVLWRSGMLELGHIRRLVVALRMWDRTPVACLRAHAESHPDRECLVDELGALSYRAVDERTNAIADGLSVLGVQEGDRVAIMCRNHRGFVEALLASGKLGCTVVLLNTDFGAGQLAGVIERERPSVLVHDEEFDALLGEVPESIPRVLAWHDRTNETLTLERLARSGSVAHRAPPSSAGRTVILSAGTTGAPKGVVRSGSTSLRPLVALLERVPLRARERHVLCSPMFHGWGYLHLGVGLLLGYSVVLQRRFDAGAALALIAEHRAGSASMVPVMLQRIMELEPEVRDAHDTSSLRAISLGGSAIPSGLAVRTMDALGDVVYNTYGSTEVSLATVATPAELRCAPGTAGKPLPGTAVRVLGGDGRELPAGEVGGVFVGSTLASEGYSDGGSKSSVAGLLSTGDLGHFDECGRLFIDGREDEMIVSGGENVYPGEVEDTLVLHPAIVEAAAVGVEDGQFGQRLCAFVVCGPGRAISPEEARTHVKTNLARYKVPREVHVLEELPRNPAGKVLKRELVARALAS